MTSPTDRIEKEIVLDSPRNRVWRALTNSEEFGKWFGVALATPFAPGAAVSGTIQYKGNPLVMTFWIETIEPERRFSFRWHPYAIDQSLDYTNEPTTLVTFTLADATEGTKLTVTETGFDALPKDRQATAFASNSSGWAQQTERIRNYLAAN